MSEEDRTALDAIRKNAQDWQARIDARIFGLGARRVLFGGSTTRALKSPNEGLTVEKLLRTIEDFHARCRLWYIASEHVPVTNPICDTHEVFGCPDCKPSAQPVVFKLSHGEDEVFVLHPDNLPELRRLTGALPLEEYPRERAENQLRRAMAGARHEVFVWRNKDPLADNRKKAPTKGAWVQTHKCSVCNRNDVRLYRPYGEFLRGIRVRCKIHIPEDGAMWYTPLIEDIDGSVWGYLLSPPDATARFEARPEATEEGGA